MKIRSRLIKRLLKKVSKHLVNKISIKPLRDYTSIQVSRLMRVVDIWTDRNPNNNAQLLDLWAEIKKDLANESIDLGLEIIRGHVSDETYEIIKDLIDAEEDEELAFA